MVAKPWLRKRFFVDYRVQGALIVRVVLYWLMCLLTIMLLLLGWGMIASPNRPLNTQLTELWTLHGPAAVASLLVLPAVILDLLRASNRFAGPMFRLRRSLHDLAQGKPVAAVRFRQGDFWQEFADDFNTVAARAKGAKSHSPESVPLATEIPASHLGATSIA
ncbi:MAG: hypothetical protein ABSG53_12855 [Thermoguttaceae bacterium]|jgi:hypothetical protein